MKSAVNPSLFSIIHLYFNVYKVQFIGLCLNSFSWNKLHLTLSQELSNANANFFYHDSSQGEKSYFISFGEGLTDYKPGTLKLVFQLQEKKMFVQVLTVT